jgi:hypothetical protein
MQPPYNRLRERARKIVSEFPPPDFYRVHPRAHRLSRQVYDADETVVKLKRYTTVRLDDDFGHGLRHSARVALDAGALIVIEGSRRQLSEKLVVSLVGLVQCAGLLHDIKRKKKDHSDRGAEKARQILQRYPLERSEIEDICLAITNHEAFRPTAEVQTLEGRLISDCLYDADKFRWGPDNFTDTLWAMVAFYNPTLSSFVARYPKGMDALSRIRSTFRTQAGQVYGPQFIDLGIAIGRRLYAVINEEFKEYL